MTQSPTNLPAPRTRLIGRDEDVAALHELVLHADGRLVTLTGAGGSGKTSLALAVARGLAGELADGVWLVELAPLADPALVPQAVASVLGVREGTGRTLLEALIGYLVSRRLLLVLDNCEHLVDACATLADRLLSSSHGLRILATSRESLRVAAEATWRVPSLGVPHSELVGAPHELDDYAAVRLFVERARAVRPGFALGAQNAPAVAQLCRRLDGIPLALELAAARVRTLPVEQLVLRLDGSFRLLSDGVRTAPSRQQTLRATLDWSHALLADAERAAFRRLAVFVGGFDLEAAEAVVAADSGDDNVLELLDRLVDKSLVLADDRDGAARYRLLEPVRQYAWERLDASGEAEAIRRRHARYFLASVEQATPHPWGAPQQTAWLARLRREHDNLRAALGWAAECGDADTGLRLAASLWLFWFADGYLAEGLRWLEAALGDDGGIPTLARAQALTGAGLIAMFRGDYQEGERRAALSEAMFRQLGQGQGSAVALGYLGYARFGQGDLAGARELLEQALRRNRELGYTWGTALAYGLLGEVLQVQGEHQAARAALEVCVGLAREAQDYFDLAGYLCELALVVEKMGDDEGAAGLAAESLELIRELGTKVMLPESLEILARVAGRRGLGERAARLFGASEAIREAVGASMWPTDRQAQERYLVVTPAVSDPATLAVRAAGRALGPEQAIGEALATLLPTPAASREVSQPMRPDPLASLTRREREVLALLARGLSNQQIAQTLVLSPRTVETHVGNVLAKLGLASRAQVAAWAVAHGLAAQQRE